MKTQLFLIQLIILSIYVPQVFCQKQIELSENKNINIYPIFSGELFDPSANPEPITFFNREWIQGDVYLKDGGVFRGLPIRYNGLLDELFCLKPGSNQVVKMDKQAIYQFHFLNYQGDTSIYFRSIRVKRDFNNDSVDVFVQAKLLKNISLLIKHSFYFVQSASVRINNGYFMKDIYKEEPLYFLLFNDRQFEFRKLTRKNLYSLFPDHKKQISKYLYESATGRIKTPQEAISFINFLNYNIDQ